MKKLESGLDGLLEKIVLLAVFFFPILIVLVKSGGTTIFGVLTLISLYVFFGDAIKKTFSRDEKLVFYSLLFFFLLAMFISLISGFDREAWKNASRFLNLLFAVPLYFLFKKYFNKTSVVWWGLFFGVVFCGLMALYEAAYGSLYFPDSYFNGRAKGATHPILFADLVLSMTVMLLMGLSTIKKWNHKLTLIVAAVLLLGVTAVVLSKTRGTLVILPILVVMLFWQIKSRFSTKTNAIVVLMVPIIALIIYLIPATGLQQRLDNTFSNVQKYSQGTHKATSVGTRFEMWKASLLVFEKKPLLGVGWGNYQETAQQFVDEGKVNKSAIAWNNPHSEYFSVLVNGGLISLFALMIVFLVPINQFRKLLLFNDSEVRAYALAGIVLVVGYMGYAFSESIFERTIPTAFFAFYLALFFALANRKKEEISIKGIERTKKLSVIVIAYNEEDRLDDCLKSVYGWADEIVVFDNGSTDDTIDIAKKYTDKVFVTDWPGYGIQKQRALEKAQYEWILSLDADERLTPELRMEIDMVVEADSPVNVYKIPMADIVLDKRLDFGLNHRAPKRLFLRDGARFTESLVHEKILIENERLGELHERLLHDTYRDLHHAVQKLNSYASSWAEERFEKGKTCSWISALLHGGWNFVVNYFLRLGILDGFRGLILGIQMAVYTFNKYAALWVLNQKKKLDN